MPPGCSCTRIMQGRAPNSGGSLRGGGAGDPTITEKLIEVERLLANKKPWPAFLHGGLVTDCPDDVQEALSWMASGAVGLLNLASIGPLTPVCQAFKGLIEAAEGAAEADEKLRGLITWCVFLTEVLLQHGKEVDALAPVMTPLGAFVDTANELATRARTLTGRRKWTAICCYWRDGNESQDFDAKLRRIWGDIQGLTTIAIHADLRRILPPQTGEMAKVPDRAVELPSVYLERRELLEGLLQDLMDTNRATDKAHVLRGITGGGKTVAASAVVRDENVRRSFKDGIFWVQVGQVGTGHSLALLRGLAEDLSHAPSNRPHVVPHGFRNIEHIIRHLAGIREQGNLRCLIVLDDVWDPQIAPLFLRTGFHCLVTTRDLAAVPLHLRGTCTAVDMLTEVEALKLLKEASGAASSIPREEGLKVADHCGFLPLAISIVGAMSSSRSNLNLPETWKGVHAQLVDDSTLVKDHMAVALSASFRVLHEGAKARLRKLGVLARGVRVSVDMVAHLWEQDPGDTVLMLKDLVGKSFVKVVEQRYFLDDLVLDFAKGELKKWGEKVQMVTSRQAQYLGRISVLNDYAKAEVLRGFHALMALWQSVEDLSGDTQLETRTYNASLKALEGSKPTAEVAFSYWAAGKLFGIQGKYEEAEPLQKLSLSVKEKVYDSEHPEVAAGLNDWAGVLMEQGEYEESKSLYMRSLSIHEHAYGPEHSEVAADLSNVAGVLMKQGKYEEAAPLYRRSLDIDKKLYGPEQPEVATGLNDMAVLLVKQGKCEEAFPLQEQSLAIKEKFYGPEHPALATGLCNWAVLLENQGRYAEADLVYQRSLAIDEKVHGPEHPEIATSLSNWAGLLVEQGKHEEAEPLYRRSMAIDEKFYGPEHPEVATGLSNWAGFLEEQGKYEEAEPFYKRSLAIDEKNYDPEHPEISTGLSNLAGVLTKQGKHEEAGPLYERLLAIKQKVYGPEHLEVATGLGDWAKSLVKQGKYEEAEPLYKRSLDINEKMHGPEHLAVATGLSNWAVSLNKQYDKAEPLLRRSLGIKQKAHGPDHPEVATSLINLAVMSMNQGKHKEAESLHQRSLAIQERVYGPEHEEIASNLQDWAGMLEDQGKYEEAESLYERSLAMQENVCGLEHLSVATGLQDWAGMLEDQEEYGKAIPLLERALSIRKKKLGEHHPDTVDIQDALDLIREEV